LSRFKNGVARARPANSQRSGTGSASVGARGAFPLLSGNEELQFRGSEEDAMEFEDMDPMFNGDDLEEFERNQLANDRERARSPARLRRSRADHSGASGLCAPARAADLAGLPATFLQDGALDLLLEYARRLVGAGIPT